MALAATVFTLTIMMSNPINDVPPSIPLTENYRTQGECEKAAMTMLAGTTTEQMRQTIFQYVTLPGDVHIPWWAIKDGRVVEAFHPEQYIVDSWSCTRQRRS